MSSRGYVYSIQYHIVWCVKYRHKVLLGDVDASKCFSIFYRCISAFFDYSIVNICQTIDVSKETPCPKSIHLMTEVTSVLG
ncbi:transposase [Paenibacillus terrigena]|uniref:transposase n=1 Tax=Paenibacillus terrigena TaxID=369333 RepID=UPI0028D81E36|nr:transposase [Paenibacillus terrigena]